MNEPIEKINRRLQDVFGIDTVTGQPIWRIVWSDDQYEKRMTKFTPEGLELLYEEIKLLPKYQWIKERWILERLVLVPIFNQAELGDAQISYETLWTFETDKGEYLPPKWEAAEYIINMVYLAQGKPSNIAKYRKTNEDEKVEKAARIDAIKDQLYGDESSLMGETHNESGSTIIVPQGYKRD